MNGVAELIRELKPPSGRMPIRIVEVGVFRGDLVRSILAQFGPDEVGSYFLVDPWKPYAQKPGASEAAFEVMYRDMCEFAATEPRAVVMRMTSLEAAALFAEGAFDLVFIDADHVYESVRADIQAWLPLVIGGGYLAGHDFTDGWPGVKKAVSEVFPEEIRIYLAGGVWAVKKGVE